jgi:hypothetical protein
MSSYKPKTRSVTATVYTSAGWISGAYVLPPIQGFLDFLNQTKSFVKLTNVRLPDGSETPFLAMPRSVALVIVPDQSDTNLQARSGTGLTAPHRVLCLLDAGVVEGTLEIATNLRVSDYLMQHTDFIALRDATIRFAGAPAPESVPEKVRFLVVFAGGIVGISEGAV